MSADNRIVWSGLTELIAALRALPTDLVGEATGLVTAAATESARRIVDLYPTISGDLKDRVVVDRLESGPFGVGLIVRSKSKLAAIFEYGSVARHTDLGYNRGMMPASHTVARVIAPRRRELYQALADLLRQHGLQVTGA